MNQFRLYNKKVVLGLILLVSAVSAVFVIINGKLDINNKTPEITILPKNNYDTTLTVAADFDYEPYSFIDKNGNYSGYDVELAAAIANQLGMNLDLRLLEWSVARSEVIDGNLDLLMGLEYKPEDLPEFRLSIPLHNDQFVAFGKKKLEKLGDLYGTRIAALENSGSYTSFLRYYRLEKETSFFPTYGEAFTSLLNDKSDYVICRYSVGRRAVLKLDSPEIQTAGITLADNYFCLGSRTENSDLMLRVNDAILELIKDGTIDLLKKKWLGKYVDILSLKDFFLANLNAIVIIIALLISVSLIIYGLISRRLMQIAQKQKERLIRTLEYQQLLTEATKGLYESIYEYNITKDCAIGEATLKHYERLGAPSGISFSDALRLTAEKQMKKEFAQGYLDAFLPVNVLAAYKKGITKLQYECMITVDGKNYYWIRIITRIFYWQSDSSVHMISYRQNIDNEKRNELKLREDAQRDPLTNLYNKRAAEKIIADILSSESMAQHAFIMLDIDNFKHVNDSFGHAFGDFVLKEFVVLLKKYLRKTDLLGRVGGDEFVVLMKNVPDQVWLIEKIKTLSTALCRDLTLGTNSCGISASMGIALFPQNGADFETLYKNADTALYCTKTGGKNGYTFFAKET